MSSNSFQHIPYFWMTIKEMARVLKPGGVLYIIAPSTRYDGKYSVACWAFNRDGLKALADYSGLKVIECVVAGVPSINVSYLWDSPLDDAILVAYKIGSKDDSIQIPSINMVERRAGPDDTQKYDFLYKWMSCEQNEKGILKWFKEKNIKKANLYGAVKNADILVQTTKGEVCFISTVDENVKIYQNKKCIQPSEICQMHNNDLPIITAILQEQKADILQHLKAGYKGEIYGLDDIVNMNYRSL